MVCGHRVVTEALAQMPRRALRHLPRVDEDQRRPMFRNQLREALVVLVPDFMRHHGVERRAGNLDREIDLAPMPFVDDDRGQRSAPQLCTAGRAFHVRRTIANEKSRHLPDRLLSRRQADALKTRTSLQVDLKVGLYDPLKTFE